jgi:hypothetical protein
MVAAHTPAPGASCRRIHAPVLVDFDWRIPLSGVDRRIPFPGIEVCELVSGLEARELPPRFESCLPLFRLEACARRLLVWRWRGCITTRCCLVESDLPRRRGSAALG